MTAFCCNDAFVLVKVRRGFNFSSVFVSFGLDDVLVGNSRNLC